MASQILDTIKDKTIWFLVKVGVFALIIFAVWVLTKDIDEGIVYHKEFRRANNGVEKIVERKPRSKGRTPLEITKTIQVSYPDRWVLYIHSESKEDSTLFFVKKEIYDKTQIGDKFSFSSDKATRKEPYTKVR